MPDSSVTVVQSDATTANVDTRTVGSDHRQVVVVGDPDTNANVADVQNEDATQTSTLQGLVVRLAGSARVHQATAGTFAVYFDPANPAVNIGAGSLSVYLSGTAGTIAANIGTIAGTAAVFFSPAKPTVRIDTTDTVTVRLAPETGLPAGTNTLGSMAVFFSPSVPTVTLGGAGTLGVHIGSTGGTLVVKLAPETGLPAGTNTLGSMAVFFSPSNPKISLGTDIINTAGTAILPATASASTSTAGGSGSNTVVSPEAGRNIKVYAYSLTTTAQVGISPRFTTGSSGGAGELWRVALQAPGQGIAGANLAVQPPGFIFATGTGNTLALFLDSASLVHYSVAYFKESA